MSGNTAILAHNSLKSSQTYFFTLTMVNFSKNLKFGKEKEKVNIQGSFPRP